MLGSLQAIQHNSQQQQPQTQQQPQQSQQAQQNPIPPPPPQNGQDFTLSSVLHYLQTEWRRYERDRNEWEIERAEMRARIALLEGERRSFENVKLDLLRRIKMLEYALRMERSKQLTQTGPSSKTATIQSQAPLSKDDAQLHKDDSGHSSPRSEDSPLPDSRLSNGNSLLGSSGRQGSWGSVNWTNGPAGGTMASFGKPPPSRDPKSRARSRDFLKQCLQEITYLTSPQAMNPLPNRPLLNNAAVPVPLPNPVEQMGFNGRPRKVLLEASKEYPPVNGITSVPGPSSTPATTGPQLPLLDRSAVGLLQPSLPPQLAPGLSLPQSSSTGAGEKDKDKGEDLESRQVTVIFRPDEAGEWRDKLHSEQVKQSRDIQPAGIGGWGGRRDDDDDVRDEDPEIEEDETTMVGDGETTKTWKAKRTLRNHLDAVRALSFHPNELSIATGGDDCTVKIWRMDVASLTSSTARPSTEIEPQLTLRGHSAAITRLIYSASKGWLYSASLDSSIRIWSLPAASHTPYAPYDDTQIRGELVGHTDAVWDLALLRDENTLVSCGGEGAVKVWDVSLTTGGGSLRLTWGFNGLEARDESQDSDMPGATAVEAIKNDLRKIAVAYQNAVVKIFDAETGKELMRLPSDTTYDGTPATQINQMVSHPTMSLLVTAHEDKYIRIFDTTTGQCTHSMLAHLDGVTSLSIDPSGFSLVSGSHDCSVRFWDLLGSRACVQEITTHREKAREGVLCIQYHPSLPFMASAGADGVVKLYASSS
ncbi:hypothetical protein AX15_005057 [Amanita polypyramis BW_CC]|nr:hypothetical protein AX15_005057 [Amanita polypyramis BW_CC]